jgi:hypothetical protein
MHAIFVCSMQALPVNLGCQRAATRSETTFLQIGLFFKPDVRRPMTAAGFCLQELDRSKKEFFSIQCLSEEDRHCYTCD